jgi:4-amino-4-deoxy-L-arabinose transferase-like glycosyltransferase
VVEKPHVRDALLVAVFGFAALFPFLGQTHDVSSHEIRHAEIGREMAASGDFLIPTLLGRPYQDKLPLMSSAVALLYRAAGEPSIGLARLPSALAGIAGAMFLYGIGCTLAGRHSARLAAIGILGVQGYQDVARTARPDMLFVAAVLLACCASTRTLAGNANGIGFAIAGAACAAASALKGPLAWVFCALFPYAAWLYGEAMRRPRGSDWVAFVAGFAAAAAIWVVPVVHRDGGVYLWSFLTQPDLTTWHLVDSIRRPHWPWLYGAIGVLPLALLLPLVVEDARRQGLRPPLAIALAMLIVLSIIPKKRMHYSAPVLPFLALAITASVENRGDMRTRRAAQALVAIGLISALVYFALVLPRLRPGEDGENVVARRILERLDPVSPVVCFGEMAERLAFLGRRTDVSEIIGDESLFREMERRGSSASIVLPSSYPPPAHLRPTSQVETSEGLWRIYRVDPRVDSG